MGGSHHRSPSHPRSAPRGLAVGSLHPHGRFRRRIGGALWGPGRNRPNHCGLLGRTHGDTPGAPGPEKHPDCALHPRAADGVLDTQRVGHRSPDQKRRGPAGANRKFTHSDGLVLGLVEPVVQRPTPRSPHPDRDPRMYVPQQCAQCSAPSGSISGTHPHRTGRLSTETRRTLTLFGGSHRVHQDAIRTL